LTADGRRLSVAALFRPPAKHLLVGLVCLLLLTAWVADPEVDVGLIALS
jgi:hypothetical protein